MERDHRTADKALYDYTFTVNGVRVVDSGEPHAQERPIRAANDSSIFKVRKPIARHHGIFKRSRTGRFQSTITRSKKFSAAHDLYLHAAGLCNIHGQVSGSLPDAWSAGMVAQLVRGRAHESDPGQCDLRKATNRPMIVVMQYSNPGQAARFGPSNLPPWPAEPGVVFPNDVVEDVIPFAEKMYRISARADDRAIAGLSMGGNQTLQVGLTHLDTFHYIGAFSPVVMNQSVEQDYKAALSDPAATNKKLKLFYIYCGKTDTLFRPIIGFRELLLRTGIKINPASLFQTEEWHVWRNWRDYLADFVPRLFQ